MDSQADEVLQEKATSEEFERLSGAVRFTMEDHQRLLRRSNVEDICPSKEICFQYSDRVRCGPCAAMQSARHGVEIDRTLPFSAEEYRLRRDLKALQEEAGQLRETLRQMVGAYDANSADAGSLRGAIEAIISNYRGILESYGSGQGRHQVQGFAFLTAEPA